MRKFYLAFPILGTTSPKLTWSHYFELLKCDNSLEMQFYYKECIKEGWKVREPCRILLPVSYNIQFILFAKIVRKRLRVYTLHNSKKAVTAD